MTRLLWLPSVLRSAGLTVIEMGGWESRGKSTIEPKGVVCHHTATGTSWSNLRVAELLRDGRPDLPGPLSQLGLQRNGAFVVVASGRANHNGYGLWGNDSIGIEAYNDGRGEPWNKIQMAAYAKGCAAICKHYGWNATKVLGHKETDPDRKIDPTFDMRDFRTDVMRVLNPPAPIPTPEPTPRKGDKMWFGKSTESRTVYCFDGGTHFHVASTEDGKAIAASAGQEYKVATVSETTLKRAIAANGG